MIGYLFDDTLNDILLDRLLVTAQDANVPFCAISIDSMKRMLTGESAEVLLAGDGSISKGYSSLPSIVDCTFPADSKLAATMYGSDFLREVRKQTHICIQKTVVKARFPAFLFKVGLFKHAIPTLEINDFADLQKGMSMFPNAILKPSGGRMGAKVYQLHGNFVDIDGEGKPMTEEFCNRYLREIRLSNMGNGLLQPYMDFHTMDGRALEFKLLRHRDENGEWRDVGTYAMVGASSVVANISKGGSFEDVLTCLKDVAGTSAEMLYDSIMELGIEVAKGIEKIFGLNAYCLGIDIAIERGTLHPYVIEANTYPNSKRFTPTIAEKRLSYYKYLQKVL